MRISRFWPIFRPFLTIFRIRPGGRNRRPKKPDKFTILILASRAIAIFSLILAIFDDFWHFFEFFIFQNLRDFYFSQARCSLRFFLEISKTFIFVHFCPFWPILNFFLIFRFCEFLSLLFLHIVPEFSKITCFNDFYWELIFRNLLFRYDKKEDPTTIKNCTNFC